MTVMKHPRNLFFPIIISFAVIALLFGMWTRYNLHRGTGTGVPDLESGTILPIPQDISPFQLVDMNNQSFTNERLKGKWSMIFFGFTHCPVLCPTTLTTLNKMYLELVSEKEATLPQVIFISVDPGRDKPKDVGKYATSFNQNFIGVTGKRETIDQLTKEMSVLYMKVKNPNSKNKSDYIIDHSGTLLLMNPQGKLFAIFSAPHDAEKLSHDFRVIGKIFR